MEGPQSEPGGQYAIVCCSDGKMLPAACCTLLSASRNAKRHGVTLFLLAVDVNDEDCAKVAAFSEANGIVIDIVRYQTPDYSGLNLNWPRATLARLHLDGHIPASVSRLLYLDSDTLVVAPIDELLGADLQGHALAAVEDYVMGLPRKLSGRRLTIGLPDGAPYFNAGVILFDWPETLRGGLLGKARKLLEENNYRCLDQDALNAAMIGRWLRVGLRWNAESGFRSQVTSPAILHFAGARKPWQARPQWPDLAVQPIYLKMLEHSAWPDFCARATWRDRLFSLSWHIWKRIQHPVKFHRLRRYFSNPTLNPAAEEIAKASDGA